MATKARNEAVVTEENPTTTEPQQPEQPQPEAPQEQTQQPTAGEHLLERLLAGDSAQEAMRGHSRSTIHWALAQLESPEAIENLGLKDKNSPDYKKNYALWHKQCRELARHIMRMLSERYSPRQEIGGQAEGTGLYGELPLEVDYGVGLGVHTKTKDTVKRSGILLGLRVDHAIGPRPKVTGPLF